MSPTEHTFNLKRVYIAIVTAILTVNVLEQTINKELHS